MIVCDPDPGIHDILVNRLPLCDVASHARCLQLPIIMYQSVVVVADCRCLHILAIPAFHTLFDTDLVLPLLFVDAEPTRPRRS